MAHLDCCTALSQDAAEPLALPSAPHAKRFARQLRDGMVRGCPHGYPIKQRAEFGVRNESLDRIARPTERDRWRVVTASSPHGCLIEHDASRANTERTGVCRRRRPATPRAMATVPQINAYARGCLTAWEAARAMGTMHTPANKRVAPRLRRVR
jgi:hypothetical protein